MSGVVRKARSTQGGERLIEAQKSYEGFLTNGTVATHLWCPLMIKRYSTWDFPNFEMGVGTFRLRYSSLVVLPTLTLSLTPVDLHHPRNLWRKAPLPCQLEKNIVCFQLGQVTCSLKSVPSIRNNRTNTKIAVLPDSSDLHFLPPTRWKSKHWRADT
jgi:hypothetical protein